MRLEKLLIATAVFFVFIIGGLYIMFGVSDQPGVFDDYAVDASNESFDKINSKLDNITGISQSIESAVIESPGDESEAGWAKLVSGSYKALRGIPAMFGIVLEPMNIIAGELNINPIFTQLGTIIVLISIGFTILYMIFRFMPRD